MSAARTTATTDFSSGTVEWRRARLLAAGFAPGLATRLAADDSAVDLHALLALIDRGCAPTSAARILAPVDGGPGDRSERDC